MDLKECKEIYDAAVAAKACKGNIEAAKRYLDTNDTEGFERVCRGNVGWLKYNDIHYLLSDGIAESWHDNGVLCKRGNYVNGEVEGLFEMWYESGVLSRRANLKDGKFDGLYTQWYENGVMSKRFNCVNGLPHGLYEGWSKDGSLAIPRTYINGDIQK